MLKLRTFVLRALLVIVCLLTLSALVGAVYQSRMEIAEAEKYQPLGRIIDIGDQKLHLNCQGSGAHTVVLDHGLGGGWSLGWENVQAAVSNFAKVCSYDRAGYGWSDDGEMPRTSSRIANELHELLITAGVAPPYIMAGHSFGGINIRAYTDRYPEEVVALVFIDPATENDVWPDPNYLKQEIVRLLARLGVARLMKVIPSRQGHSPEFTSRINAGQNQTRFLNTLFSEQNSLNESAAKLKEAAPVEGLPIVALMAGANHDNEKERLQILETHRVLFCKLSSRCEFLVAEDSGHQIPEEDPDAVVRAIQKAIDLLESD